MRRIADDYRDYVERERREGRRPLSRTEWLEWRRSLTWKELEDEDSEWGRRHAGGAEMDRQAKIAELEARAKALSGRLAAVTKQGSATLPIRGMTTFNDAVLAVLDEVFDAVTASTSPVTSKERFADGTGFGIVGTSTDDATGMTDTLTFRVDWATKTFEVSGNFDSQGFVGTVFKAPLPKVALLTANRLAALIRQKLS